jgi:hypothetical protein
MSIDTPPIPPLDEQQGSKSKRNTSLDLLIGLVIVLIVIGGVMWLLTSPLFPGLDSLTSGLIERIDQGLALDFLEGSDPVPEQENSGYDLVESVYQPGSGGLYGADEIPLGQFNSTDLGISFSYPLGWEIEQEEDDVTFYHPEDLVFIYLGEFSADKGDTAKSIAVEFLVTVEEEAQGDSFELLLASDYPVKIADDAYLVLFEWIDDEGDYAWAYDLETVSGESNIFIFFYGADRDEMEYYGELLDIIASSMEKMEE